MIRIIFFDLDGTLVEEDSSWRLLHRFLGTDDLATKALKKFSRGEINYEEFVKHDVGLWPKGLPKTFFEQIFSRARIRHDSRSLFKRLKEQGVLRVIVTSGLDVLAKKVCRELEADECVSNEMVFDAKDCFTGVVKVNVDPSRKAEVLTNICRKYSIPLNEAGAVGDTVYDKSMFKVVSMSILYVKPGMLPPKDHGAKHVVNNLEDVGRLVD
ncbi:MAG: HAD-IB family phosphatase [Thermoproteota archaeon]